MFWCFASPLIWMGILYAMRVEKSEWALDESKHHRIVGLKRFAIKWEIPVFSKDNYLQKCFINANGH